MLVGCSAFSMGLPMLRVRVRRSSNSLQPACTTIRRALLRNDTAVNAMTLHMARLKTATLNLRLDPELKALAERAATSDQRTLTSLIEKLLTDHLKAKGYMPIPKQPRPRT